MQRTTIGAIVVSLCLAGVLTAGSASAGHHEKVLQAVSVNVEPGNLDAYKQKVKQLSNILERVGSSATMRMWQITQGGPDTGSIFVGVEYANMAAWAGDSAKIQADDEWQSTVGGLDEIRTLEGSAIWTEITPTPGDSNAPGSGSVLLVTGVSVNPGRLDEYRDRVGAASAITERLGLSGKLRIWEATLAGENTGNVAVGVEYDDVASYVANQAKLQADPEWQKLVAGLDEIRTLRTRFLYREITP